MHTHTQKQPQTKHPIHTHPTQIHTQICRHIPHTLNTIYTHTTQIHTSHTQNTTYTDTTHTKNYIHTHKTPHTHTKHTQIHTPHTHRDIQEQAHTLIAVISIFNVPKVHVIGSVPSLRCHQEIVEALPGACSSEVGSQRHALQGTRIPIFSPPFVSWPPQGEHCPPPHAPTIVYCADKDLKLHDQVALG